jgi:hypothetical protein
MIENNTSSEPIPAVDEAISRFKTSVESGQNWFLALLEAIKTWPVSQETYGGKIYNYVISGEALDMLQIAERLLTAAGTLVPEEEKINFLFHNKNPLSLTMEETRARMGEQRLGQYLNFFYGITVEEALLQAVEEEVRKADQGLNSRNEVETVNETYKRIYDVPQRILLNKFRNETKRLTGNSMTLEQLKEFSYWRFKYRLKHCDKARIASDTKKALTWMQRFNSKQGS